MAKCFVVMPYGKKPSAAGDMIDFDQVYNGLILKSLKGIDLEVYRSDQKKVSGWIHEDMIRDIATADVCIVDMTTHNPNVFYELGVRHALRPNVTVLIGQDNQRLPFDIQDLRVIFYGPPGSARFRSAQQDIAHFVRNGLKSHEPDNIVFKSLPDLQVRVEPDRAINTLRYLRFPSKRYPKRFIGLIGGDIVGVEGIPVWVNSENTNMQMSRFYEKSISGIIRYQGASKDGLDHVMADLIGDDLALQMGANKTVAEGTVIKTTAGQLKEAGVKFILHVAAVNGRLGRGYEPVPNLRACVTKALQKMETQDELKGGPASVLMPLFGTGTAGGPVETVVPKLFDAALDYLEQKSKTVVGTVWFLAYTHRQWAYCEKVLRSWTQRLGTPVARR